MYYTATVQNPTTGVQRDFRFLVMSATDLRLILQGYMDMGLVIAQLTAEG
jgi:hypothetical protein